MDSVNTGPLFKSTVRVKSFLDDIYAQPSPSVPLGFAGDGLNKRKQLVSASSLGQNNLLFQSLLLATSTWVTHLVTKLQSSEAGAFNVAPVHRTPQSADLGPVGALGFCLSMRLTTCMFTPTDLQATVRRHRVIMEQNLCRMFLAHCLLSGK